MRPQASLIGQIWWLRLRFEKKKVGEVGSFPEIGVKKKSNKKSPRIGNLSLHLDGFNDRC